ncbi:MAG: hypothetical protein RML40_07815 [Bacteroidota bacterium]|nr:hypothetical protein [Candidatus Kapabacteria bacterium]MDW8220420.1 hypothetical protein [Bacteroidota bacterium]
MLNSSIASRVEELFAESLHGLHVQADRIFVRLLFIEWVVAIALALIVTPRTWIGGESSLHIHVLAAIVLGGLLALFPLFLIRSSMGGGKGRS